MASQLIKWGNWGRKMPPFVSTFTTVACINRMEFPVLFYELGCTECDDRKTLSMEWRQAAAGLDALSELGPPTSTPFYQMIQQILGIAQDPQVCSLVLVPYAIVRQTFRNTPLIPWNTFPAPTEASFSSHFSLRSPYYKDTGVVWPFCWGPDILPDNYWGLASAVSDLIGALHLCSFISPTC